jgi:hypothetical protein
MKMKIKPVYSDRIQSRTGVLIPGLDLDLNGVTLSVAELAENASNQLDEAFNDVRVAL